MNSMVRRVSGAAALGVAVAVLAAASPQEPKAGGPPAQGKAAAKGQRGGFPDLIGALKAAPGCLGVDAGQMMSGKQVIFAWFESKKALMDWYDSDVHMGLVHKFSDAPPAEGHEPMADIADDVGPILAIASLTMSDKPQVEGIRMPISQIAIELYKPLNGGISMGGRFAPEGMKVPSSMKNLGGEEAPAEKKAK